MIAFKRINHVHISVPSERLEEARIFYTKVIGLAPTTRPNEVFDSTGYWFKIADIELHIGTEPVMPRSIRHYAFEVDDLTAARKHLQNNDVELMEEPVIPGRMRFSFIDPFGNRVELLQLDSDPLMLFMNTSG
jgi:catechol 2,3-dioxygenase-like lactoylglutathione lyase family enzyme